MQQETQSHQAPLGIFVVPKAPERAHKTQSHHAPPSRADNLVAFWPGNLRERTKNSGAQGADGVATEKTGTLSGTKNDGANGADGVATEYVGTPIGTNFSGEISGPF